MFQTAASTAPPRPMIFVIGLWAVGVVSAWGWFASEHGSAGPSGVAPVRWPSDSQLTRDPHRFSLVMFAHPRCPCLRASLEELARVAGRFGDKATINVVFFRPPSAADDWTTTDQWRTAASTPGVVATVDVGGREARRFGATTSGQVVVYDPAGELRFQGGVTAGRGHAGDNIGSIAVQQLLRGETPETTKTPVYGCSMVNL